MTLAQSIFQTGADDALKAIDVYNQSGAKAINSIRDTTGYIKSIDKALASSSGLILPGGIEVSSILNVSQGQLTVNPDAMLKAALKDSPKLMSAYQSLSDARKVAFTAMSDVISLVKVTKGAAQQFLNSAPINDIRAIVGMVMAVADGCPLFPNLIVEDIGALKYMMSQLIKEATNLGLDGLYAGFAGCPKISRDTMRDVTGSLGETLYLTCSNDLLLEIAQGGGGTFLLEQDPNLFRNYISKFQSGFTSADSRWAHTQKTVAHEWDKIFQAFTLIDPEWTHSTGSVDADAVSIRTFDKASDDLFEMLRHTYMSTCPSPSTLLSRVASSGDWREFNTSVFASFPCMAYTLRRRDGIQGYDLLKKEMAKSFHFT